MTEIKKARIEHDFDGCIGCGACPAIAPKYWVMEGAKAKCLKEQIEDENDSEESKNDFEDNMDAASACPVNVIHIINKEGKKII